MTGLEKYGRPFHLLKKLWIRIDSFMVPSVCLHARHANNIYEAFCKDLLVREPSTDLKGIKIIGDGHGMASGQARKNKWKKLNLKKGKKRTVCNVGRGRDKGIGRV